MSFDYHVPVLLNEVCSFVKGSLNDKPSLIVDCTFGGGGYTKALLDISHDITVIAIDSDINAIEYGKQNLKEYQNRIMFVNNNFSNIKKILTSPLPAQITSSQAGPTPPQRVGEGSINSIVADLGLSSYQLNHEPGFSYRQDTVLDMRADSTKDLTAKDILNEYPEQELLRIFKELGELKYYKQVTRDIIAFRQLKKIEMTSDIVDLLKKKIPEPYVNKDLSKVFQALRIEVNNEMDNLKTLLTDALGFLQKGAVIIIVSYHSLEDRIVKNFFRSSEELKVLTKKPVTAAKSEIKNNPRARSAKLRAAIKL